MSGSSDDWKKSDDPEEGLWDEEEERGEEGEPHAAEGEEEAGTGTEEPAGEEPAAEEPSGEEAGGEESPETPEFEEPEFPEFPEEEGPPATKYCVFCGSEIAGGAARCPHCAGFLPIAEGTIFKQYFFFLFASLALVIGSLLPWERTWVTGNLTGADSIGGGFVLLLAAYGLIVSVWNIYHRKMIVWPVILAAIDGAIIGWSRVVHIWGNLHLEITAVEEYGRFIQRLKGHLAALGPGLYLVTIFSTMVLVSIVISVFKGAKQDAQRKAREREARFAARKSRRA